MPEEQNVPTSPEVEPANVRKELDQQDITHQGQPEQPEVGKMSNHMGAVEDEVTPIRSPMSGPSDLVGESHDSSNHDDDIDPRSEITPG